MQTQAYSPRPSRFMQTLGLLRLLRLSNSISASVMVLVGGLLAGGAPLRPETWQAALAMWFVSAFGYASNDLFDVHEDRVNKPSRPLPSTILAPDTVIYLLFGLAIAAVLTSLSLGTYATVAAAFVMFLLLLYSKYFKSMPGVGNALIALLASGTLLVGSVSVHGIAWNALRPVTLPMLILASFVAAREVIKTIQDIPGDRYCGKRTMATAYGISTSLHVVSILTGGMLLLSIVPSLLLGYSTQYLVLILVGVGVPLIWSIVYLHNGSTPSRVRHTLILLKGSYFAGIAAFLLAH